MYLVCTTMYLVCTRYCFKINQSVAKLWIEGMVALFLQISRIASCTHHTGAPEQLFYSGLVCTCMYMYIPSTYWYEHNTYLYVYAPGYAQGHLPWSNPPYLPSTSNLIKVHTKWILNKSFTYMVCTMLLYSTTLFWLSTVHTTLYNWSWS
jgi:hypothetical protein